MEKIRTGFILVPEFKTKEELFLWLDNLKPEDYTDRLTIEEKEDKD